MKRLQREVIDIVEFDESPKRIENMKVQLRCDGPKCGPSSACKGTMDFVESSEPGQDGPPNEFFRNIAVKIGTEKERHFFTRECLRDFLRTYKFPLSPKEQAGIKANNEAVDATKIPQPVGAAAYSVGIPELTPDSDATGFKE